MTCTALLVEDQPEVRLRLEQAIRAVPHVTLQGSAGTLQDGRALLRRLQPDVLIVDLGLPDGSGIDLIREALALDADTRVMVVTLFGDEAHVVEAIRAGATSYLLKDASTAQVSRAIGQLLEGGSPLSPNIARFLLRQFQQSPAPAPQAPDPAPATSADGRLHFSPREFEVLQLVAKGLAYSQIATTLDLSINTIGTYVKQIYRKLAVTSRGEAVYEAQALGILHPLGRPPN